MFKSLVAVLLSFSIAILAGFPGFASAQQPVIGFQLVGDANVKIDGVWTSAGEWSKASVEMVNYTDGSRLAIRGMHDSNFVYVMLEMPDDYVIDGHGAICFGTEGDGGTYLAEDDYCFVMGTVLKEYHGDGHTTLMQPVLLDEFVVAQRGLSDSASPLYSSKPHVTYEFRVPLDYLGSDKSHYGFYVSFDTRGQTNNYTYYYSWPDYKTAEYLRAASPRAWGVASLSSDADANANVPEFPIPAIGAIAAILGAMAILTRMKLFRN